MTSPLEHAALSQKNAASNDLTISARSSTVSSVRVRGGVLARCIAAGSLADRCTMTAATPPTRSRLAMRMAPAVERFGQRWLGRFAGVSVIESGKQLYAGVAERSQSPALVAARPKLRIASSRDTHAARNAGDGEAPAS